MKRISTGEREQPSAKKSSVHIVILPSWYPLEKGDYVGSFFREQAIAYKRCYPKHRVGILYAHYYSLRKPGKRIRRHATDEGVETYIETLLRIPKLQRLQEILLIRHALRMVRRYIHEQGLPDLIHVQSAYPAGLIAKAVKHTFGIPYLVTEHSSGYKAGAFSPRILKELHAVFRNSCSTIAVSESFATHLAHQFCTEVDYIPNAVAAPFFLSAPRERNREEYTFVSVGRLAPGKGMDLVIEGFSRCANQMAGARLVIAGEGPLYTQLQEQVKRLDMGSRISFTGRLNREATRQLLHRRANAFVLASHSETFSVVCAEALASGLPVIATRCGGPESIVSDEVGYLVENRNASAVADALYRCYKESQRWQDASEQIVQYCRNRFSDSVVANRYYHLYNRLLTPSCEALCQ